MTQRAPATDWEESFWGGSEEAEERQIAVWAQDMQDIQLLVATATAGQADSRRSVR